MWTKRERILEKHKFRCYYCNVYLDMLVGVQEPTYPCIVSYIQGLRGEGNEVACCRTCSRIKQNVDAKHVSLASVRKWVNKERCRLGYPYNKDWMESDADEICPIVSNRPSIAAILAEAERGSTILTPSPNAPGAGGQIENEDLEYEADCKRRADAEWKAMQESSAGAIAEKELTKKHGVKDTGDVTTLTPEQLEEWARLQKENAERVVAENRRLEDMLRNAKSDPNRPRDERGRAVDSPTDRPKVIGVNTELDSGLDE